MVVHHHAAQVEAGALELKDVGARDQGQKPYVDLTDRRQPESDTRTIQRL